MRGKECADGDRVLVDRRSRGVLLSDLHSQVSQRSLRARAHPAPARWSIGAVDARRAAACGALALVCWTGAVLAGEAPSRQIRAQRVPSHSIDVDGRPDDAAWRTIPHYAGFTQQRPLEGRPATEPTSVAIAYDDDAVYVLVEARDSRPGDIRALLTRRDEQSSSDWINLWLDTYDDGLTAYRFSVNPRGVKQDARVFEGDQEDTNWDAVWQAATRVTDRGWTAEYRIPFSQLRYDPSRTRWGLQVGRVLQRAAEQTYLSPVPQSSTRFVRHFGTLTHLEGLPRPLRLELIPYARGGASWDQGNRKWDWSVGGDGRAGIGPSLTLDFSVNPDFGQVEADPSELNLSAYETFFAEKRPFFLQAAEIFRYQLGFGDGPTADETLFYSRRIGRAPSIELDVASSDVMDLPVQTTILGAVKLTGKTSDGWSIGVMDGVTKRERARVRVGGVEERPEVEPPANATVARISKSFRDGETTVGGIVTRLRRYLDDETSALLPQDATSGGLDVEHRMGDMTLLGRVFGTYVRGSAEAISALQRSNVHAFQRPDARHLSFDPARTSMSGWGLTYVAGKLSGQPWRGASGIKIRSPGLEPNDLGYLRRADTQSAFGWLQYRRDEPNTIYEQFNIDANVWGTKTFGSERTETVADLGGTCKLRNFWTVYAGAERDAQALDVTSLRGGPGLLVPGSTWGWWGIATDDRKAWVISLDGWAGWGDEQSMSDFGTMLGLSLRPTASVQLSLGPSWEHSGTGHQYVDTLDTGEVIVGRLRRQTASLSLRASWAVTTSLTLQLYAMPYWSAGTYGSFYVVSAPRASTYRERFTGTTYGGDDRFLFEEVRSNVVLRWEYMDGSTLFVVWSHDQGRDRNDVGVLSPGRDIDSLVGAPSKDMVTLKLAHWFAM